MLKYTNAALFLPIVQAMAAGKIVQLQTKSDDTWIDVDGGGCNFSYEPERYRIKPEPNAVWVVYANGRRWSLHYCKDSFERNFEESKRYDTSKVWTYKKFIEEVIK